MTVDIIALIMSGISIVISIIAVRSNIKTGNEQVEIKKMQTGLQEKQVAISESQSVLQQKQVSISQAQIDFQNKVELYLVVALEPIQGGFVPAVYIRNAGNGVVYLTKYELNGKEVPMNKFVLPSMSICNNAYYSISLPIDGTPHFSLKIQFEDWQNLKWKTEGYIDYQNGIWELTYSPCERRKED